MITKGKETILSQNLEPERKMGLRGVIFDYRSPLIFALGESFTSGGSMLAVRDLGALTVGIWVGGTIVSFTGAILSDKDNRREASAYAKQLFKKNK